MSVCECVGLLGDNTFLFVTRNYRPRKDGDQKKVVRSWEGRGKNTAKWGEKWESTHWGVWCKCNTCDYC